MKKLFWILPLILITACRLSALTPDPTSTSPGMEITAEIPSTDVTPPTASPAPSETPLLEPSAAPETPAAPEVGEQNRLVCGGGERMVALLVDPALAAGIQTSLDGFSADLCSEDYSVVERIEEFPDSPALRAALQELFQHPELDLQGALLIGDHPFAYQYFTVEYANPDLPPSSQEVISIQYYSDLDGEFLTSDDFVSPGGHPDSFDIHQGEVDWEIWIGVLPRYRGDDQLTISAVNSYLAENHAYRTGEVDLPRAFLNVNEHYRAADQTEYERYLQLMRSGQYAWTPFSEEETARLYFHAPSEGLSAMQGYEDLSDGYADFAVLSAHGSWRAHGPLDLTWLNGNPLRTIFFWSNGCAVGNLDYPQNFLTEALYHPDSRVLVAKGTTNNSGGMGTNQEGFFGHNIAVRLEQGMSFGEAVLGHVNVPLIEPWAGDRELHFATSIILGDPTLKLRESGGPTPTPDETAAVSGEPGDGEGFVVQASYAGNCAQRPEGSICLQFSDGYTWLIYDSIVGSRDTDETYQGKPIQIRLGAAAEYHHVLGSNLVKEVPR